MYSIAKRDQIFHLMANSSLLRVVLLHAEFPSTSDYLDAPIEAS